MSQHRTRQTGSNKKELNVRRQRELDRKMEAIIILILLSSIIVLDVILVLMVRADKHPRD